MGTHALNKLLESGAESSQCMWCCFFDMAHNYDMKVSVLALCNIHTGYVISKTLQFQPLQDPSTYIQDTLLAKHCNFNHYKIPQMQMFVEAISVVAIICMIPQTN